LVSTEEPISLTYDDKFNQGITLNLSMNPNETMDRFWIIKGNDGNSTFNFYVVCDIYISQLFGFSVNYHFFHLFHHNIAFRILHFYHLPHWEIASDERFRQFTELFA